MDYDVFCGLWISTSPLLYQKSLTSTRYFGTREWSKYAFMRIHEVRSTWAAWYKYSSLLRHVSSYHFYGISIYQNAFHFPAWSLCSQKQTTLHRMFCPSLAFNTLSIYDQRLARVAANLQSSLWSAASQNAIVEDPWCLKPIKISLGVSLASASKSAEFLSMRDLCPGFGILCHLYHILYFSNGSTNTACPVRFCLWNYNRQQVWQGFCLQMYTASIVSIISSIYKSGKSSRVDAWGSLCQISWRVRRCSVLFCLWISLVYGNLTTDLWRFSINSIGSVYSNMSMFSVWAVFFQRIHRATWWSASLSLNTLSIYSQLLLSLGSNLYRHSPVLKKMCEVTHGLFLPKLKLISDIFPSLFSLKSSTLPTSGDYVSILLPIHDQKISFYGL